MTERREFPVAEKGFAASDSVWDNGFSQAGGGSTAVNLVLGGLAPRAW